jgi:alpha-D-xyloside xylohydrolase
MKRVETLRVNETLTLNTTVNDIEVEKIDQYIVYTLKRNYQAAFGFGEKFDHVNHFGKKVIIEIRERCFYQGDFTYCTFPFFSTPDGFGLFVNTSLFVEFDFTNSDKIIIKVLDDGNEIPTIYIFEGTIKQIIGQLKEVTGKSRLFPKWTLGAWLSSNRWKNKEHIDEQIKAIKETNIPHNVMVIERWSDLTTFYNWNEGKYNFVKGDEYLHYEEFDFTNSCWKNPKEMINELHDMNIKVLLWDLPVFVTEKTVEGPDTKQRYIDNEYIIKSKECVMTKQGTPYIIPPGNWFAGSMIPDFTNKDCTKHWFNHRKHLLEIGVDGFKTDGGEFVHSTDALFANNETGLTMKSGYADSYIKAYHENLPEDKVIYSRAGNINTANHTILWAGDQESTWSEFRSIVKAGLSSGLSGISSWGFDIAGFAGYLPSKGLYLRSMQMGAFSPIMQYHSEPITNGRCDFTGAWNNNDRTPWNISAFYKDTSIIEDIRKIFNLRYNLIPYLYALSIEATDTGVPVMRHLAYEFEDVNVYNIEDEYMLGNALLVAPVLEDYTSSRKVYLPEGTWLDLYENKKYQGSSWYDIELKEDRTPVFIKQGTCIPVNLDSTLKLSSYVGNDMDKYDNLCFIISGSGSYDFSDDLGNQISFTWKKDDVKVELNKKNLDVKFIFISEGGEKLW